MFRKALNFQILSILIVLGIFLRYYYLQVYQYQEYDVKAGINSVRKISLYAPRGILYDRNSIPLVDNQPIYDLSVIPFDVSEEFNYAMLAKFTNLTKSALQNDIQEKKKSFYRFRPYTLRRHVDFEIRSRLEENKLDLPGMMFSEFPARTYPNQAKLTHVLGYLRVVTDDVLNQKSNDMNYQLGDVFGFSGIEKMYESFLKGKDGVEFRMVDIYGIDHGLNLGNPGVIPVAGEPLYLTIDSKLQFLVEELFKDKIGAAICMVPNSGEILAFVSAPDYDLSSFVGPIPIELWESWNNDPAKPLMNRVIQGVYPPGSTFKLVAAALALEQNEIDPEEKINCSGSYLLGDRVFHCWNTAGHGSLNLKSAIQHSCNIYFYHLIQKLSFKDWWEMAESLGFGTPTGVDLYGEKSGMVPTKSYLNEKYGKYGWATGNLLNFVIGQGDVLVTPLQVTQMMNLIAAGGKANKPHLLKGKNPKPFQINIKNSTWEFLQTAVWEVVNNEEGTGKKARLKSGGVHGKTGTAQNPHGEDHSWFSGYLVKNSKPVLSLTVLVENGGKGSVLAAGIAEKIFQYADLNYQVIQ